MRICRRIRTEWLALLLLGWGGLAGAGSENSPRNAVESRADVVVYGGTPGGIATAVAARRQGASVVLVETTKHLGGMTSGGLSRTDVGPKPEILGGFAREFFARADAKYPAGTRTAAEFWFHEPHVAEQTFIELLREAGVQVVFAARMARVEKAGLRIVSFKTVEGEQFFGRVFVDASYEGDLMARAGVRYAVGREGREVYGESLAGFRPAPLRPRSAEYMATPGTAYTHGTPVKISAYGKDGRLLPGIERQWPAPGSGDRRPQSYNFRVILTKSADRARFPKPAAYDPLRYEILARIIDAYPGIQFEKLVYFGALPNGKFDANASGLVQGTDHVGGNVGYPEGDYATRDRIWQDHVDYVQGLFWFMANDPRVLKELRDQASQYGLAKDEFVDNGNWPYALYVREARRMIGAYVMRQDDCAKARTKPDTVGMGAFILDSHAVERLADAEGNVIDEGNFDVPVRPYQIPYRCLTPKKEECENLLVPVCLSASHVAYGSIRMEPQFMILGHSCGVAATMAIESDVAVQDIDVRQLQARLRREKQVLEWIPGGTSSARLAGIVVDDEDAAYEGQWLVSGFGEPIDGSSRHDGNSGKGKKTAQFEVSVPASGRYEVRFAYTAAVNRASNVPLRIVHADGVTSVTVNERETPKLEKHFVGLGAFRFTAGQRAAVIVGTEKTDGYVSVDAIQLLEAR